MAPPPTWAPPSRRSASPSAATRRPSTNRNTTVQSSWRANIPIDPLAAVMPAISPEGFEELVADIGEHGILNEITIYQDENGTDSILDGCTRLDAAERAGVPVIKDGALNFDVVPHRYVHGNTDREAYVRAQNLLRKHYNSEQKRDAAAKLLKAMPGQSNRAIAKQLKIDNKTVASVRRKLESTAEIPQLRSTVGAEGRSRRRKTKTELANSAGAMIGGSMRDADHDQPNADTLKTDPPAARAAADNHMLAETIDDSEQKAPTTGNDKAKVENAEADRVAGISAALAGLKIDTLIEVLRPHIQRLGREGLCQAMTEELKSDLRDRIIGQAIAMASKKTTFATHATGRLHAALRIAEKPELTEEDIRKVLDSLRVINRDAGKRGIATANVVIAEVQKGAKK